MILPSGHLKLIGRLKELINRGGEKISPLEVDSALLRDDSVEEAVCFGVEDAKYGEVVWAGVVLRPGQPAGAEERIKKGLEGKIAKFKIPERCVLLCAKRERRRRADRLQDYRDRCHTKDCNGENTATKRERSLCGACACPGEEAESQVVTWNGIRSLDIIVMYYSPLRNELFCVFL